MELDDLLRQLTKRISQRKLYYHKPYGHPDTLCPDGQLWKENFNAGIWGEWSNSPWQLDFHEAGLINQERMLICGNRVGKCLTLLTKIETSTGYKSLKDLLGSEIEVLTYPDKTPKKVLSWVRKPAEECFRVTMSDGQWFECPKGHLILTDQGFVSFGEILDDLPDSVVHDWHSLLGVRLSVRRLMGTVRGFLERYFDGFRLSDGQLLTDKDNVQVFAPSPNDVQEHNAASCKTDDLAYKCTSSLLQAFDHLSSLDAWGRVLGRFCALFPMPAYGFVSFANGSQSGRQFRSFLDHRQLTDAIHSSQCRSSSYQIPSVCGNHIVSVYSVGVHPIYDFEVEDRHQYLAAGLCHHNSESGGYEVALHMTGEYPDWWEGRRFNKPVLIWTGSPTTETSRDIIQKALIGGTSQDELGTGFIPADRIIGKPKMRQAGVSDVIDSFKARHKSGGVSTCILKTYEQGWRKWQGTEPHVVWIDEEPEDMKIYTEALTRLLTSHGLMMVTFTPLLGMTKLVTHFQDSENDGVWLGNATWEDAPHLLKQERERMKRSYRDHEVQARTMGVPMMGEGAIFTTNEDLLTVNPFPIPNHWLQIKGIDFGIGHPFGFGRIAWDRDSDVVYVTDSYRKSNKLAPYHAEKIKGNDNWIPVAWPHDGHKRDGLGVEYQKRYRDLGVNMLSQSARYNRDKGGAQDKWKIIEEIREREETGRFKIFKTATEYLEERRNYHIKMDKNDVADIVDRKEDVLKAVFYAVMSKKKGKTPFASRKKHHAPQRSIMSVGL